MHDKRTSLGCLKRYHWCTCTFSHKRSKRKSKIYSRGFDGLFKNEQHNHVNMTLSVSITGEWSIGCQVTILDRHCPLTCSYFLALYSIIKHLGDYQYFQVFVNNQSDLKCTTVLYMAFTSFMLISKQKQFTPILKHEKILVTLQSICRIYTTAFI